MLSLKKYLSKNYLFEINAKSLDKGVYDINDMTLEEFESLAKEYGINNIEEIFPNYKINFYKIKNLFSKNTIPRSLMPRITKKDIWLLQDSLKNGRIDIFKPFAKETDPKNPFPEGLTVKQLNGFLENGLKDGEKNDDIIDVKIKNVKVSLIKPVQSELFVEQIFDYIRNNHNNLKKILTNLTSKYFILSKDYYLLDGHHSFALSLLLNLNLKVNGVVINLPEKNLLKLLNTFSDAVGNERNF